MNLFKRKSKYKCHISVLPNECEQGLLAMKQGAIVREGLDEIPELKYLTGALIELSGIDTICLN